MTKAAAKELGADAAPVLDAALSALEEVGEWTATAIEVTLKVALLENLALKPRKAFGPIRVAATGSTISPPLFESLELLGRERSLRRLRAGRDRAATAHVRDRPRRFFGSLHVGPKDTRRGRPTACPAPKSL